MLYTWSSAAYFEAQTDSLCILLAKSCEKPLISKSNFYWTSLFLIWIYRCIIITLILIKSSKGIQIYSMKCIQTKLFMHPLQSKSWLVLVAGAVGVGGLLWHRCKKSTVNFFILFLAMLMHIIVASQFGLVAVVRFSVGFRSKITILWKLWNIQKESKYVRYSLVQVDIAYRVLGLVAVASFCCFARGQELRLG